METGLFAAVALAGAFGCAFFAGRAACLSIEHAWQATRGSTYLPGASTRESGIAARSDGAANALAGLKRLASYYVRNGFASLAPAASLVLEARAGEVFRRAERLARSKGIETAAESVATLCIGGAIAISVASLVLFRSLAAAACAPVLVVVVLRAALFRSVENERARLREQVPDALRCMEACLHAGLSLPQTFYEVSTQIDQPARGLFARVSRDLELGYSMNEALERFRSVAELPELSFVAMALDVQYACGGSATPILRSAEQSVASDLELRRSLRVQTAQAKLSAQIVSIMPFALVFVISALDPGFLAPFFSSAGGALLLLMAVSMLAAGVLMVRRMLAIEI